MLPIVDPVAAFNVLLTSKVPVIVVFPDSNISLTITLPFIVIVFPELPIEDNPVIVDIEFCTTVLIVPSIFALIVPCVPENIFVLSIASGIKVIL